MRRLFACLILACASMAPASAQLPHTITCVVGFAVGGFDDAVGRILCDALVERGYAAHVENLIGASGKRAFDAVRSAPPDGSVIFAGSSGTMAVAPHVAASAMKGIPVDALKHAGLAATFVPVLVTNSCGGTVRDFAEYVREIRTRDIPFGSSGPGTSVTLGVQKFAAAHGFAKQTPVQFKGFNETLRDLLGGQSVCVGVVSIGPALEFRDKLTILAAFASTPLLPNVPVLNTDGFGAVWLGVYLPKETPESVVNEVNAIVQTAFTAPKARKIIEGFGGVPTPSDPDDHLKTHADYYRYWERVVPELMR